MTAALAYLRVSGLSQVEGQGFHRQEAACYDYAAKNDLEIVHVYREEGVTGKSDLDGRPTLRELIADVLSNGTRIIIVERLDRLARDLIVQETIIQDLHRKDIKIISAAEPDLCSADPTRTLIRQILGSFFEYERKMIVAKLSDARKRIKVAHGRCEGRLPFGKKDGEESILGRMIMLKRLGKRAEEIAVELNATGVLTRYGKSWNSGTVYRILKRHA